MKVYIAGPMRGKPGWNYPAFDKAMIQWQAAGHYPFSPVQMDRALNYGPQQLQHVMLGDIAAIFAADVVALLPGWEASSGATVEVALAQFLGLKIYDAVTMSEMCPPSRPWSVVSTFDAVVAQKIEIELQQLARQAVNCGQYSRCALLNPPFLKERR